MMSAETSNFPPKNLPLPPQPVSYTHLRFKLEDELIRLWQMTGTTVLFITHNIEEAVYLGEHIMILTNKPTTVKQPLENHLPRPRDIAAPRCV